MANTLYICKIIKSVLDSYNIHASKEEIYKYLFSDDSFPSTLSVLRTLSIYGVYGNAYELDYATLCKYDKIAIIHCKMAGGHFYIFKKDNDNNVVLYDGDRKIKVNEHDFLDMWDGYAILIENVKHIFMEKHKCRKITFLIIIFLSILAVINAFNIRINGGVYQVVVDYCGLYITYLLMKQSKLSFYELPFCHRGKLFDCNVVNKSRPFGKYNIDFSALGFFYFMFDMFCMRTTTSMSILVVMMFIFSTVFVTVAIFYQMFIIKKMCAFCLCVSALVYIKFLLFLLLHKEIDFEFNDSCIELLASFLISLLLTYILWYSLIFIKKDIDKTIELLRFKRNGKIFDSLIRDSDSVILNTDTITFGSNNPRVTIKTILRPGCHHCKNVVRDMVLLLEKNPDMLKWVIYFDGVYFNNEKTDLFKKANLPQLTMMQVYKNDSNLLFNYLKTDKFFFGKHKNIDNDVIVNFQKQLKEINTLDINQIPIIIYNDHILPNEYGIKDLDFYIPEL